MKIIIPNTTWERFDWSRNWSNRSYESLWIGHYESFAWSSLGFFESITRSYF
jgi:hypothetical protein